MDNNMMRLKDISPITTFIFGIVIGLVVYGFFLQPEVETKIVETIKIDTKIDSVAHKEVSRLSNYIDSLQAELGKKPPIEHEFIRDTILVEGWKPRINRFRAVFPHVYGNAYLSGEVLGEILNTELTTDFKLPTITHTITKDKTTTRTIIQKGIFVGGGFSNQMDGYGSASYLGNGFLATVNYTPNPKSLTQPLIQADIKLNLFRIKK